MGHEDKGHYAQKHTGASLDPIISEKLKAAAEDGQITCSAAHRAANELGVSPLQIGIQTDLVEFRISKCQLGLFGYSTKKKKLDLELKISSQLHQALDDASEDGRISCTRCWEIAKTLKCSKLELGSACEIKSIRIKPCQLGAF